MIFGIDTASAGGVDPRSADWDATAAAGIEFHIGRVTYSRSLDKVWRAMREGAKAAHRLVGDYIFAVFSPDDEPAYAAQIEAAITFLRPALERGRDLPPALDVEFPGGGRRASGLQIATVLRQITAAVRRIEDRLGVTPMLYTSGRVWHEDLGDVRAPELADRCPLWLARYPFAGDQAPILDAMRVLDANKAHPVTVPPQLGDRGDWVIHQFQGNAVRCPGLAHGRVDVNRFNVARPGDTGDRVTWVQRKLKLPETSGTLDVETAAALRTFQAERGLAADAVVGPRTFAALAWA